MPKGGNKGVNKGGRDKLPPLMKLKPDDVSAISSMFRLYDYKSTGNIPKHLAKKLTVNLGFEIPVGNLGPEVNLKELLLFVDQWLPEHETQLQGSLYYFQRLASERDEELGEVITPDSLNRFMQMLDRPPISMGEANLMLSSMLDYDDCADKPKVRVDEFGKDVTMFTKKTNVLKDFH